MGRPYRGPFNKPGPLDDCDRYGPAHRHGATADPLTCAVPEHPDGTMFKPDATRGFRFYRNDVRATALHSSNRRPAPRGFSLRISHAVDRSYHQHFRVRRLHRPCEPSLDQRSGGLIATSDEMDRYVPSQKHYPLVLSPLFPGSGRAPAPGVLLLSVNSGFACGPAAGVFEDC